MLTSRLFARSKDRCALLGAALGFVMIGTGCSSATEPARSERTPLVAACAINTQAVPDGAWICGDARTVECDSHPGTASPATIYVVRESGCDGVEYTVATGPFTLGRSEVIVTERVADANGGSSEREVCRSNLDVVDTTPPSSHSLHTSLWPPNHRLHTFTAGECARATDLCDPTLDLRFSSVSSDEPEDAEGDGSHAPDVIYDGASTVALRAERQGGGNGRVYELGWIATDRSGNETRGVCTVAVPHDASGREAVADSAAYAVPAPGN